ncbi:uncharacterized protein LOC143250216 [Tachypleus tridentatus]|uniref:uncharacterized protein LOC143250216 n=1 Tax=Tachypleus tridentatus TaxID=6853 RepID=UPI003FD609F3
MLKAVVFMTFIAGCFAGYLVAPQAVSAAYDINVPTPYETGYDTVDEFGTRLVRQETGDGAGRVQGSYGYADAQGIWRDVKYVADEGGFRASVSTNEPGTANQNPADVEVSAQEPPAGVQPVVVPSAPKAVVPAVKRVAAVPVVKRVPAPAYYGGYYGAGVGAPYYGAGVGASYYGAGAPYYGAGIGASYYGGRIVGAPYYAGSVWPATGRYALPAHRVVKVLH